MPDKKNLDKKTKFIFDIKALEIESIKYLIKCYLRVRLSKVIFLEFNDKIF